MDEGSGKEEMQEISVIIVDDHHVMREALSNLLSMEQGIYVVGEAKDGDEAIKMTKYLKPDVVIMDITMPVLNGEDALRIIKRSMPETKVLILTMHNSKQSVCRALKEGASGYLLKDATSEELVEAIMTVYKGGMALSPSIAKFAEKGIIGKHMEIDENEDDLDRLTDRERQILSFIAEGKTNKEIANCLSISKSTVNIHRTKMMQKLDLHDTIELIKYCIEKEILIIPKLSDP